LNPLNQTRTLAEELRGAFLGFGAIVAVAFCATALVYLASWAWFAPELERSRAGERAESDAFAAMLDQENGIRAYLLAHEARYVEPYLRAEVELQRANQALTESVGAVPELAAPLMAMRLAAEKWREQWAKHAADTRPGAVPPSGAMGKELFDAYRTEQAVFAKALHEYRDRLADREHTVLAARVALELTVFLAVLGLALRQHRKLRNSILSGDEGLRDHSLRLRQILDASREFAESLNLRYVVGAVRESTAAVGGYETVIVWLMDDEQMLLVNADVADSAPASPEARLVMGQGLAGRAAKSGRITFENAAGKVRFGGSNMDPARAIAIPLIVGARVVGALEARHTVARIATREVVEVLEMLATHAATAIESARLHEVIEERSHADPLTRLLNRRRLDEDLEAECKRCLRYGRPLAFVMMDVDHFKAFNDTHGHPQADTALQHVADVISGCMRTTDTAYRYGGEEFCMLLRETTAHDAMHFAERVRQRIEHRFASGEEMGITASFGVAGFSAETATPRALTEAADAAMYAAKHAGRNCVSLSTEPPAPGSIPYSSKAPVSALRAS
jgi:diguanylate cyclase (GGDEF)-like protein